MTLGNMRQLGVKRLIASCLKDACRHQGLVDVSTYPADTEVPWFRSRVKCTKCGGRRQQDRRSGQTGKSNQSGLAESARKGGECGAVNVVAASDPFREGCMRRREFLGWLTGGVIALPFAAGAQGLKVFRVGIFSAG